MCLNYVGSLAWTLVLRRVKYPGVKECALDGDATEGRSCNDHPCAISGQGAYGQIDDGFRTFGQGDELSEYLGSYNPAGPELPGITHHQE